MKIILSLFSSLFLILCSCQEDKATEQTLQTVNKILATNPDSAFVLLQSINAPESLPTRTFSRWCLLYAQACDEAGEDMPFVSQLKRTNEYFAKHGSPGEKALCELYLGHSHEEDKEFDRAMQHFLTASDIAKKAKEYKIEGNIYNHIAQLYEFNDKNKEAQMIYQKAGDCFMLAKDSINYAYALRNIGWTYARENDFVKALDYCEKAYDLSIYLNDSTTLSSLANRIGIIYKEMRKFDLAEEKLFQSIKYQEKNSAPTYLAIADLFFHQKQYDKSLYYIQKASESKTANRTTAGAILYQRYLNEKDLDHTSLALDYYEQYVAFNDSVTMLQEKANSEKVEKRYEQSKLLNANYELYTKQQRTIILCILLILASITTILFYKIRISRKNKRIHKQQELIQGNHAQLMAKELSVKGLEIDIQQIRENILHNSAIWEKIIRNSKSIPEAKQFPLTEKEWLSFTEIIKATYISFQENLFLKFPGLTVDEFRFCCLLKAGLNSQELSIFLNIQPESVNHKRYRVMKKGRYENKNLILENIIYQL